MDTLLSVEDVSVYYGKHCAVRNASFVVNRGEVLAILGPNGAGKTTTAHVISGLVKATSGRIELNGNDIANKPTHEIVKLGLCQVPEGRRLFNNLTVEDNLTMGAYTQTNISIEERIEEVLGHFPEIREKLTVRAGQLSGGQQQMVAIGRALMAKPLLLIVDEPTMGLAPIIVERLGAILRNLNENEGLSILVVDQRLSLIEIVADRAHLMKTGNLDETTDIRSMSRAQLETLYLT